MMMDVFAGLVEGIALNLGQPFDQEFLQRPMTYIQHNRPECGLQQILKFAILTNDQSTAVIIPKIKIRVEK